jgi:hypothetical protein
MHRTKGKTMYGPEIDCRHMLVEHLDQSIVMVYLYVVVKT